MESRIGVASYIGSKKYRKIECISIPYFNNSQSKTDGLLVSSCHDIHTKKCIIVDRGWRVD